MDDSSLEHKMAALDRRMKRLERHMLWANIVNSTRLAILIIPIALALIFVPPVIREYAPFVADIIETLRSITQQTSNPR